MSSTVQVLIPTPLRRFTGGDAKVEVTGGTLTEVLDGLDAKFPGFSDKVREDDGQIRRFVNVFVNGVNVRELSGAETAVKQGDEIGIIPAMAGGAE
ncbi:MAG: ubiquitin-like small modifier protein 1 [Thermomicrobiales bacterium]